MRCACRSRLGRIVVIEGAPGIGKSSLLERPGAGRGGAHDGAARAWRGDGAEFALGVVIQLLAPSIEPLTGGERERAFAGAAGLARPLFEEVPDRAAADGRLFARFHGLHWLCARLAERAAARPAHRRRALGRRALAPVPRLPGGEDRGDPGLRDPRGADGRGRGAAGSPDQAIEREPLTPLGRHRSAPRRSRRWCATASARRPETRSASSAPGRRAGTRCSRVSSLPRSRSEAGSRTARRRHDRRHGPALGGPIRGRPAEATPAGGRGRRRALAILGDDASLADTAASRRWTEVPRLTRWTR